MRKGWGPVISNRTAWLVMETPALYIFLFVYVLGENRLEPVPLVLAGLWTFHYFYRSILYPLAMPDGERKVPLSIVAGAILFNLINAYLQARYLSHFASSLTFERLTQPCFIIGVLLFFCGFCIHRYADKHLHQLKKQTRRYSIPYKGLFRWITAPNYLGEIVQWSGWALATWSLPGLVFAVWTFANLFPRALAHHRWYREKFPDYPQHRKAIIPFIV